MATVAFNQKKKYLENPLFQPEEAENFEQILQKSWEIIAPFWPLKNLIAVNPLKGLEGLAFEEALLKSSAFFEQSDLPKPMEAANRETIKWLQAYFDEGQATISMPLKKSGLYSAWRQLAIYDKILHRNQNEKIKLLFSLSDSPKKTLVKCLSLMKVPAENTQRFLELLLTTLPGWASYIKYQSDWSSSDNHKDQSSLKLEYLAMRAVITYLFWPEAKTLLQWHRNVLNKTQISNDLIVQVEKNEKNYRDSLLSQLANQTVQKRSICAAQLVFCIDVRSEPMRKAIEATGNYETFGLAGFFGIPAQMTNNISGETYASCPVLLTPKHEIKHSTSCPNHKQQHQRLNCIKKLYQSVKYSFTTPFAMVESLGIFTGLWIGLRTFTPNFAFKFKNTITNFIRRPIKLEASLDDISFEEQCSYAESALRMIGLTNHFAPFVVFCGHGSTTQNNAFASSLDCGACGGRNGSSNAQILAMILNNPEVKKHLSKRGINIPKETQFIGGEHNTTTDELTLYGKEPSMAYEKLKKDLIKAQEINNKTRIKNIQKNKNNSKANSYATKRSLDWAQVRPEWGLAKNAAFIAAPRSLTKSLDLSGRCFLHSYDPDQDSDGKLLETILTAPMVVAQWINAQYLFSTLNNASFGSGSKITKNITGKIGIMQGNASDLMTGLPLQSVYSSDLKPYHQPQRLMTVVYAPINRVNEIIHNQPILQKLFRNGWVQLICIEPQSRTIYHLQRSLTWAKVQ